MRLVVGASRAIPARTLEEPPSWRYLKADAATDVLKPGKTNPAPPEAEPVHMANYFWQSIVALPLLAGCYQYVPAKHTELSPPTPVSVALSPTGTKSVADRLGANVLVVSGSVTQATASSITLSLQTVRRRGESSASTWAGESITLATDDIDRVSRRELSRKRTTLASVALGAASVGLVVAIAAADGSASGGQGGKPSPNP